MKLFEKLLIETHGACNRACPTCLTQSYPKKINREKVIEHGTVLDLLNQAKELGFNGPIGFVWFNEPLLDPRLPRFIEIAKKMGYYVYIDTNSDFLDLGIAQKLQQLDEIVIAVYDYVDNLDARKSREQHFLNLFPQAEVHFSGRHITTHYSPHSNLQEYIEKFSVQPCFDLRRRMIVTCTGEMALCCEDIGCEWNLGSIYSSTLEDLWFSPKHIEIMETLGKDGGRKKYDYCRICPRN